MFMYDIEIAKNTFFLNQWENGCAVKNTSEKFSDTIVSIHPLQQFFTKVKTGVKEIKIKNIIFNIIEYYHNDKRVMFTTDADFETVAYTLLRFKNKYEVSLNFIYNHNADVYPLNWFLKVEYVKHCDKPNDDFLITRNFYNHSIDVTKSGNQQNIFYMFMTFKHIGEQYNEIFVDTQSDACFDIELDKKTFCTVYTDKKIDDLVEYLLEERE